MILFYFFNYYFLKYKHNPYVGITSTKDIGNNYQTLVLKTLRWAMNS